MVPGFQVLMRPLLVALSDGELRSQSELRDLVAADLGITAEDRAQLLPSGRQAIYSNRIGWALTYLVKSGLLTRPRRGYAQLTDRGRQVLGEHPSRVDLKVLAQFPEFEDFRTRHAGTDLIVRDEPVELLLSPTESISGLAVSYTHLTLP